MFIVGFMNDDDMLDILNYDDFLNDLFIARRCVQDLVHKFNVGRIRGNLEQLKIKLDKRETNNFKELFNSCGNIPFQYEEYLVLLEGNNLILRIEY